MTVPAVVCGCGCASSEEPALVAAQCLVGDNHHVPAVHTATANVHAVVVVVASVFGDGGSVSAVVGAAVASPGPLCGVAQILVEQRAHHLLGEELADLALPVAGEHCWTHEQRPRSRGRGQSEIGLKTGWV